MRSEKRKNRRRAVRLGAAIQSPDGTVLGACLMVDVSGTGARLIVKSTEGIPDQFRLVLSRDGLLRRQCRVAWRTKKTMGVHFDLDPRLSASRSSEHAVG